MQPTQNELGPRPATASVATPPVEPRLPGSMTKKVQAAANHAKDMLEQLKNQNDAGLVTGVSKIYQEGQDKITKLQGQILTELDWQRKGKFIVKLRDFEQLSTRLESLRKDLWTQTFRKTQQSPLRSWFTTRKISYLNRKINKLEREIEQNKPKVVKLKAKLEDLSTREKLTGKEKSQFKERLEQYSSKLEETILETQLEMLASSTGLTEKSIKDKVKILAQGGGWLIKKGLFSADREALDHFKRAKAFMQGAAQLPIHIDPNKLSKVEKDKLDLLQQKKLAKRVGVIGVNGIYRIAPIFSKEGIKKQFKSFQAQRPGDLVRRTITEELTLQRQKFTSELIPLNNAFDDSLHIDTHHFGSIFGDRGIPSSNRHEEHLINGYHSTFTSGREEIFSAFRHGVLSDKYKSTSIFWRPLLVFLSLFSGLQVKTKSTYKKEAAAKELGQAALMKELALRGLTPIDAAKVQKPISITINSVSLITPDDLRAVSGINEREMLRDQVEALHSLNGLGEIEIDGQKIRVKFEVNAFNFGVNAGGSKGLGAINQYAYNQPAWENLRKQFDALKLQVEGHPGGKSGKKIDKDLLDAEHLLNDIDKLMKHSFAYLGKNPYEVGAKILNLTNLMQKIRNQLPQANRYGTPSFQAAENCMSAKDRTSILDGVAKAFAVMAKLNSGQYPTRQQFQQREIRKKFIDILIPILKEGGSLDITELNAGVRGYKVGKEARLFGMLAEDFSEIQGLSKLASA